MAVDRQIGFETTIWCGADANAVTATVQLGGVLDLGFPGLSRDSVEVTDSDSPNRYREFIPGLIDAGDLTVTLNYDPNHVTETELVEMLTEKKARYWEIKMPQYATGKKLTFNAFLTEKGIATALGEQQKQTIKLKVTGQPVMASLP